MARERSLDGTMIPRSPPALPSKAERAVSENSYRRAVRKPCKGEAGSEEMGKAWEAHYGLS